MQEYPEQLNDWLLSNYNYIKTDSPDLPLYIPKELIKELNKSINDQECQDKKTEVRKIKMPDGTVTETVVEKLMTDKKTQEIFDRTEIIKGLGKTSGKAPRDPNAPEPPKSLAERTEYFKGIVQKIKQENAQGYVSEAQMASMIAAGETIDESVPEVATLQTAILGADPVISAIPDADGDSDAEEIRGINVVAALTQQVGGANRQKAQQQDLESLQKLHRKVAYGQQDMLSGKGGFSRS
jgi:hypothetical protein